MMKRQRILIATIMLLLWLTNYGQQNTISLEQALVTAQNLSLEAFKAKHVFLGDYWQYQSYLSQQKPHLTWYLNPASYNRRMTLRYDFEQDLETYRQQQTLSSYSSLNLSQNIVATGGSVFLATDIYRIQNLGAQTVNSWSTTPFRIGFSQPMFAFNQFKWNKKLSPLKFEIARQQYIESLQITKLETVKLYFSLLEAKISKDVAALALATSDTLLKIGKARYEIAAIQQEEYLDLQLSRFNAAIELSKAEKEFQKAGFNLRSFLGTGMQQIPDPVIPEIMPQLKIYEDEAVELARSFNPKFIELKQKVLEAEQALDKAIKNSRFAANLNASYGLNQSGENFQSAYENPLNQQMVSMEISIPLLDWGNSKGQRQMAQSQKEVVSIEVKQALMDYEQDVVLKVIDFNLQSEVVESAERAKHLAQQSYELTKQRFLLGKADVLKLTTSMQAMQHAQTAYIQSLAAYWLQYYQIQQLTLYDFRKQKTLSADFNALINQR